MQVPPFRQSELVVHTSAEDRGKQNTSNEKQKVFIMVGECFTTIV
jgi:hypothetical protein